VTNVYATIVDINYVVRGLCLYRSFGPHLADKIFAFYCVDEAAAALLRRLDLPHSWVVAPAEFETPALRGVRPTRAMNEYCWTCKPAILEHALAREPTLDWAVYLDSDMMAFGDPDDGLRSLDDAAALLTPHRFATPDLAALQPTVGTFNGGYVAFRNSAAGRRALAWWRERCLELCPRVPTDGVYADQTYLDGMAQQFDGVRASDHPGLNAAPWNIVGKAVGMHDGVPIVNGAPILVYHFQGFRIFGARCFDLYSGTFKLDPNAVRSIYRPYAAAMHAAFAVLRARSPGFRAGIEPLLRHPLRVLTQLRRIAFGPNNLLIV
jgi:hypothetical protein